MCGIAGVFGDFDRERIRQMTAAIRHRGPDQGGHHHQGECHLGIRRLSIIDLATGDQPIYDRTGRKALVMNGEIYNYRELRRRLEEKGHPFKTESDTEVVMRAYEEYGESCVEHLRGMFAFAVTDGQSIFVARDRLGIKPLYYAHLPDPGLVFFASEIKALLRCPEVPAELDPQAMLDTILFRHLFGPDTVFRHIRSLEPGSTLEIRRVDGRTRLRTHRYYEPKVEPRETLPDADLDFEQEVEALRERLDETVRSHLVADVEVGLLLSGGLDSGVLAAMMNEHVGGRLRTFTTAVKPDHADAVIARQIAKKLGTHHEVLTPTFDEYLSVIPSWIQCQEYPCSLSGMSGFLMCRHVGRRVKVCLNGEGSDELFGGYPEFVGRYEAVEHLRRTLPRLKALGLGGPGPRLSAALQELARARKTSHREYLRKLFEWHLGAPLVHQHLNCLDRMSMASSLELRVPFVDHELVEHVASLPLDFKVRRSLRIGKHILKRVALDHYGSVLAEAALRPKIGLPASDGAFRLRFERLCRDRLGDRYLQSHELGEAYGCSYRLLLFELFQTIFVEHRGELPEGLEIEDFIAERAARTPSVPAASVHVEAQQPIRSAPAPA